MELAVFPPRPIEVEQLALQGTERTFPGLVDVQNSRSHRLRPFDLREAGFLAGTSITSRSSIASVASSSGDVRVPSPPQSDIDARLAAILQPPLEELLAPGGVLEWPGTLLPFQTDGVRALLERRELLLADDMGLGKTIQVLAALRILFHRHEIRRTLIVAPASLTRQWRREAKRWAPELKTVVVSAPADQRAALWRLPAHLTIVGYETLREDISFTSITPITEERWDVMVLDEASKIKNRDAAVSRATKRVPRDRRWALTGTPLETSIEDVRSIIEFILGDAGEPVHLPSGQHEVKELLASVQLRRKKADVLTDLPSKTIETVELELPPGQRAAYDDAEQRGIVQLTEKGAKVSVTHVLELIVRLKQICNRDPASGESAKLEDIEERLDILTSEGHRALLFTQFTDDTFGTSMVMSRLSRFSPIGYTGAMSAAEKLLAEDTFKDDPSRKLMILSLRAGGMGLNLQTASYVFHLDRWWNPAIEDQADSRSHRMGQECPVNVCRYVCANTIEERIEGLLAERRALFAEVVDDVTLDLANVLNRNELFGLFGLEPPAKPDRRESGFQEMSGEEFEEWLGDLLEDQGFEVQRTQRSRDGGIDLLATKADLIGIKSRLYIQCKNHADHIGVPVVRELRGAVPDRVAGATPVIACPAGFSRDAAHFAASNGIVLWSAKELRRIAELGLSQVEA